jgi:hypothetical protein
VLQASLTIGNASGSGPFSTVTCLLMVDDGGGFDSVGPEMRTASPGNNVYDELVSLSLVAGTTVPPGSYDVGVRCQETYESGDSQPVMRTGSLVVVATGLGPAS